MTYFYGYSRVTHYALCVTIYERGVYYDRNDNCYYDGNSFNIAGL